MTTRVVHLRLPEADIARCLLLLEEANLQKEALGSAIARALKLLLQPLELEAGPDPGALISERMLKAGPDEDVSKIETPPPDWREVTSEDIEAEWAELTPPAAPAAEAPPPAPEPPPAPLAPPWDGHNLVPFQLIASECPKDRFVEAVLEPEEPDAYLIRAVEITYALLGKEQWGGRKAGELIADLMQRFHHYTKQTGEEL